MARLRQLDPQVNALVSSRYSNDPIMADYASHGFIDVISKPYSLIELSNLVHHILWRQSLLSIDKVSHRAQGQVFSFPPSCN